MPQTELDLNRVKYEMMDYMRQTGLPIFYGVGGPEEDDYTYWDTQNFPDWRQFLDVGKECGAQLLVFSSETFDEDDLEMGFDKLAECDLSADERLHYARMLEVLRSRVGQAAWLRIAFEHSDRWFAYERIATWYDEFRGAMEELNAYLPTEEEEEAEREEGEGHGYFSPN